MRPRGYYLLNDWLLQSNRNAKLCYFNLRKVSTGFYIIISRSHWKWEYFSSSYIYMYNVDLYLFTFLFFVTLGILSTYSVQPIIVIQVQCVVRCLLSLKPVYLKRTIGCLTSGASIPSLSMYTHTYTYILCIYNAYICIYRMLLSRLNVISRDLRMNA